jgi:phage/plasmid-associated DNA primase/DNA-directed RNA polymerase subunit RPC12/RpoP
MSKERLILIDGIIDISGPYIVYTKKEPEEEALPSLPYTKAQLCETKPPVRFFDFMASIFPDKDTAETVLYYLSLIVSKNTEFKQTAIFIGGPETGKTALMEILSEALPEYISFFSIGKFDISPFDLARMDGLGAAVIQEVDANRYIQTANYKMLTGGDTLVARKLRKPPYEFTPTAQIILTCNFFPRFTHNDEALSARIVVIPFSVPHRRGEPGTIPLSKIKRDLRAEFPAIVKLLVEYYVRLKHKFNGKIPLSKQCKDVKKYYVLNPVYLKCENCAENFHIEDIIIENDQDHCPYCGSILKKSIPNKGRKGKK